MPYFLAATIMAKNPKDFGFVRKRKTDKAGIEANTDEMRRLGENFRAA